MAVDGSVRRVALAARRLADPLTRRPRPILGAVAALTAAAGWALAYGGYAFVRYFRGDQIGVPTLAARGVLVLLGALALLLVLGIWSGRREARTTGIALALLGLLVGGAWLWQVGRVYLLRTYTPPVLILAASGATLYALVRERRYFLDRAGPSTENRAGGGAEPSRDEVRELRGSVPVGDADAKEERDANPAPQPEEGAGKPEAGGARPRLLGSATFTARARRAWSRLSPLAVIPPVFGVAYLGQAWASLARRLDEGDAHAYWAAKLPDPYASTLLGARDAYLYSPAFAQLIAPLTALSWPEFYSVWVALNILVLGYLLGPLLAALALLFVPNVWIEIATGNIHLMLAAAIVLGFRVPAAWAFVLLTKVTPGIGLLWFLVRGEWRSLALALGATAGIAGVSFLLAPALWAEWIQVLAVNSGGAVARAQPPYVAHPLTVRLPVAAALVTWGALTDRRWTVPVAAALALPVVWSTSVAMLVAVVPLVFPRVGIEAALAPYVAELRRLAARIEVAVRPRRPAPPLRARSRPRAAAHASPAETPAPLVDSQRAERP